MQYYYLHIISFKGRRVNATLLRFFTCLTSWMRHIPKHVISEMSSPSAPQSIQGPCWQLWNILLHSGIEKHPAVKIP